MLSSAEDLSLLGRPESTNGGLPQRCLEMFDVS